MTGRIPVAVIGTGWWATEHHVPSLAGDVRAEIVAVCDQEAERVREVAERFGVPRSFTSVEELVGSTTITAAVVAVKSAAHHEVVKQLLVAGVHVLVEKPLATTAAEAYELVRLAAEKDVHLVVGYTAQYTSAALDTRTWLSEEIGDLTSVSVEFTSRMEPLFGGRDDPDEPDSPHPSAYRRGEGGGQALTQLTHAVGMVTWATGQRYSAVAARVADRGLEVDLVDSAAFSLEGGALGVALASGALPERVPPRHRIRYIGTGGMIEQDIAVGESRLFLTDGSERLSARSNEEPGYPAGQPARYLIDVALGAPNVCGDPLAAAHAAAFTEALYRAAETERWEAVVVEPRS